MSNQNILGENPFGLARDEKRAFLFSQLKELHEYHHNHSPEYRRISDLIFEPTQKIKELEDLPFLPVQLFKELPLKSISEENIFKVLSSSGTTSSAVSRIFLDKETAMAQSKTLVAIMTTVLGPKRLPMLIVDTKSVLTDRKAFSARGAGILGMSSFGRHHLYMLDEKLNLQEDEIREWHQKYGQEKILIFGFTFMVWQNLIEPLSKMGLKLPNANLIHSGGWKKLQELAVSNEIFKTTLNDKLEIKHVYNFYGMVEQVGSVNLECEEGHLHTPIFSDIIIRDPRTLEPLPHGQTGLIQTISLLPKSYPGHSILTEDLGTILGEDQCPCGRKGKYFKVEGRVPKAELRGCSDVIATSMEQSQ